MNDQIGTAQLRGFWVWLLGTGLSAAVVFCLLPGENREVGLHALGGVFAFTVGMYAVLARRAWFGAAVLIAWGLGFGVWFPKWVNALEPAARQWLGMLGQTDPHLYNSLPLPVAIATAGITTGVLMYLLTGAWRVVLQTGLLSLIVAATPMLPNHEDAAVMAGVIAWHVAVSGSLYRWMMDCVRGGAGLSCGTCGFDLVGLSSPVCPSCGKPVARKRTITAPSRVPVRIAPPKAAGRWY